MTAVWGATGAILITALGLSPERTGAAPPGIVVASADERMPQGKTAPSYRYGFDRGWREGSESGHRDGRSGRGSKDGPKELRAADRGYGSWMGSHGDYVAGYREGYSAGYRRAYAAARPDRRERRPPSGVQTFAPISDRAP